MTNLQHCYCKLKTQTRVQELQVGSTFQAGTWSRLQPPNIGWLHHRPMGCKVWAKKKKMHDPKDGFVGTWHKSRLRYESALSVMNYQKQNWRYKLNDCIITAKLVTWTKWADAENRRDDWMITRWLILRNSTIIFPFASRVRSEARVMSNHRHQSINQSNLQTKQQTKHNKKWCITDICIHCFDTDQSQDSSGPATLNGMVDLAQALGLPSSSSKSDKPGVSTMQKPSY